MMKNVVTKRFARIQEVWSYVCLALAAPFLLFSFPHALAGESFKDAVPFLALAALAAPGQMLLMGYIKLAEGHAVWCGETRFWVCSLVYNLLLVCLYGVVALCTFVGLGVIVVLPLFSAAVSLLGAGEAAGGVDGDDS